jgi:hypothetical protein
MGFWSISGLIGNERTLIDLEQELAEVKGIIKKDHNEKNFDAKGYAEEKSNLEARIVTVKRKMNKK